MKSEKISSKIWNEIPEKDNPFSASVCLCRGYDVFNDLLRNASWSEYIYLLFIGEKPSEQQANLLEAVALVLADPGLRDHSVRAAMNGGVGGSTNVSCLMAALAVGAGQLGGSREIVIAMDSWLSCGRELALWTEYLKKIKVAKENTEVWEEMDYPAGFDPYGESCSQPVIATLSYLSELYPNNNLAWLEDNRPALEKITDMPLSLAGVVSAAFSDLHLSSEQAEMLYLILRLPGAAVHAMEQKRYGWRRYPFYAEGLEYKGKSQEDQTK